MPNPPGRMRRSDRWIWIGLALCALAAIVLVSLYRANWHTYSIPGASMEPTLRVGDYIIARLGSFSAEDISRGEVILFRHRDTVYVNRLVGRAGDAIQMIDGAVYLNGAALPTRRVEDYDPVAGQTSVRRMQETLDGRTYEILDMGTHGAGDNTRLFAVPPGAVFVLGDNRDNSSDSRFGIGYVPAERIVGIARTIIWSPKRGNPVRPIKVP